LAAVWMKDLEAVGHTGQSKLFPKFEKDLIAGVGDRGKPLEPPLRLLVRCFQLGDAGLQFFVALCCLGHLGASAASGVGYP
jgi:hypothetical protein